LAQVRIDERGFVFVLAHVKAPGYFRMKMRQRRR
jgi:hypothetical protein